MGKIVLINVKQGEEPLDKHRLLVDSTLDVFSPTQNVLRIFWCYHSVITKLATSLVTELERRAHLNAQWAQIMNFAKFEPRLESGELEGNRAVVYIDTDDAIRIAMSRLRVAGCDEIAFGKGPQAWVAHEPLGSCTPMRRIYPISTPPSPPVPTNESHIVAPLPLPAQS